MAEYTSLIATALRLIVKKGRPITVFRETVSVPDPAAPWDATTGTQASFTTSGVFQDPRNSEKNFDFALKVQPGTDVERVDWHIYIPASGATFAPQPGDTVLDVADTYRVVTCSPFKPGLETILYILQVQY